jgi:hypothetical protein
MRKPRGSDPDRRRAVGDGAPPSCRRKEDVPGGAIRRSKLVWRGVAPVAEGGIAGGLGVPIIDSSSESPQPSWRQRPSRPSMPRSIPPLPINLVSSPLP